MENGLQEFAIQKFNYYIKSMEFLKEAQYFFQLNFMIKLDFCNSILYKIYNKFLDLL